MPRRTQPGFLAVVVRPETGEITAHKALKGLAALTVILYHCALASPDVSLGPLTALVRRGDLFVGIFFILSGFILMRRYDDPLAPLQQLCGIHLASGHGVPGGCRLLVEVGGNRVDGQGRDAARTSASPIDALPYSTIGPLERVSSGQDEPAHLSAIVV